MQSQHSQRRQLAAPKPPAHPPPPRKGGIRADGLSAWVRRLSDRGALRALLGSRGLKVAGGIAAALAVVLTGVNVLLSADWVEAQIAARIKEQTGRDLAVNGPAQLLFLPWPRIVVSDATIADPSGTSGLAELSIAKLTVDLNFSDFLSRQVDAERIVLERPVLTLHVDRLEQAKHRDGARAPHKTRFAKADLGGSTEAPRDLRIEDLRIVDGTVVLARSGASEERRIEHIEASLSLESLKAPLTGRGTFQWKQKPVEFSFELATPADLRAKRPGELQVAVDAEPIVARFDGSLAPATYLAGEGRLSAKIQSIPFLLSWLQGGADVPQSVNDGELDGLISWTKDQIRLSETRFASEHASGEGEAVLTLGSPRPHIRAALALDHLDASPLLDNVDRGEASPNDAAPPVLPASAPATGGSRPVTPAAEGEQAVLTAPSNPGQPGSHLAQPALSLALPMPEAALPGARPEAPRELRPAPFDADVNLNVRKGRLGRLDIGPSALGLVFRDGVLDATLSGMSLYDGDARGTVTVDLSTSVPQFVGDLRVEGVQAEPFLTDAAQFRMIAGRTKLALSISGEGRDAEAIKSSLKGSGAFVVTDGAVRGIDIAAFIRKLGEGSFDFRQGADAKTAFGDLGGSFTIQSGVAKTSNLKILSPLLKVSVKGDVDLRTGTLQLLATPEILAGPKGHGGANDLAGLSVPVLIEGPFDSPRIQPQIGSVFANPKSASKAVSKIGAALQKKF